MVSYHVATDDLYIENRIIALYDYVYIFMCSVISQVKFCEVVSTYGTLSLPCEGREVIFDGLSTQDSLML